MSRTTAAAWIAVLSIACICSSHASVQGNWRVSRETHPVWTYSMPASDMIAGWDHPNVVASTGRVVLLQTQSRELVVALDRASGREMWRIPSSAAGRRPASPKAPRSR